MSGRRAFAPAPEDRDASFPTHADPSFLRALRGLRPGGLPGDHPQADDGQDLNTEREGLFTSGVAATPAPAEDGSPVFALAANVRAQDDETTEEVVEEIDGAEAIAIRDQRMRTLSQKYTELAQEAMDRGDLKGALGQFSDALDLDPANQTAREGFRRAEALLGDPLSGADVRFGDDVSALRIKEQMVRMRAQDCLSRGDVALQDGDFDGAVFHRRADHQYNPLTRTAPRRAVVPRA